MSKKYICGFASIIMAVFIGISNAYSESVCAIPNNPFVYKSGDLSIGIVNGDTLALYDIFKQVEGINARVGGSVTLARYKRFGGFMGAASPSINPANVAIVGGPSLEMDDVGRAMIKSVITALPFGLEEGTIDNLISGTRLKLYMGYDFREKAIISGVGFGIALF